MDIIPIPAEKKRAWQRRALLGAQGYSLASIAKEIGVTRAAISAVVNEERKSDRLRRKIYRITGIPYKDLWGEELPSWAKDL